MSQPNTTTWYQATVHTDAESGAFVTGQVVLIRRHVDPTKFVVANATTGAILGDASATALAKYLSTRRNRRTNKPLIATPTQRKALANANS